MKLIYSSLACLCLFVASPAAPQNPDLPLVREEMRTLRMRWLPARAGREAELSDLLRRMRVYAETNHPDVKLSFYSLSFRPDELQVYFSAHASWGNIQSDLERLRGNEGWRALLASFDELVDVEESWIGDLFWVGGTYDEERPAGRSVFRARTGALRRQVAQHSLVAVADHLNATYAGVVASVYSADLREPELAFLFVDYYATRAQEEEDLVTWEMVRSQLLHDEKYLELLQRAGEQFDEVRAFMLL